jgi:hypothetical protein
MNDCSICLTEIEDDHVEKTLSCGHKFHYRCFMNIVHHSKNIFIECPLCRRVNDDISKPFTDPEKNLRLICARKVGKVRCLCKTKKGTICKRKSRLFNYGMCHQHSPNVLKKKHYPLMEKYIDFILCQRYNFTTRLYSIDIGKKILLKFCDKKTEIQDILFYWFKYLSIRNIRFISDYNDIYDFYDLEKPPKNWLKYCIERHNIV